MKWPMIVTAIFNSIFSSVSGSSSAQEGCMDTYAHRKQLCIPLLLSKEVLLMGFFAEVLLLPESVVAFLCLVQWS